MAKTKVTSGGKNRAGVKRRIVRKRKSDMVKTDQEQREGPSKKMRKNRDISPQSEQSSDEESELPPELRPAGLLAQAKISKGKKFGPFIGCIQSKKKPPQGHVLITKVKSTAGKTFYFCVQNNEKSKCSWLKRVSCASSEENQNIVAYSSSLGVCYEAIKNIEKGEELFVYFIEDYGKRTYPAYVETSTDVKPKSKRKSLQPQKIIIESEEDAFDEDDDTPEDKTKDPDFDCGAVDKKTIEQEETSEEIILKPKKKKKLKYKNLEPIEIIEIHNESDEDSENASDAQNMEVTDCEMNQQSVRKESDEDIGGGKTQEAEETETQSQGDSSTSKTTGPDEDSEKDKPVKEQPVGLEQENNSSKEKQNIDQEDQDNNISLENQTGRTSSDALTSEENKSAEEVAAQNSHVEEVLFIPSDRKQKKPKGVKLKCMRCQVIFTSREDAEYHKNSNKCKHCDFYCKDCNKGFRTKLSLQIHKCRNGTYLYRCSKCNKVYHEPGAYLEHNKEMHPLDNKKCTICNIEFPTIEEAQLHWKKFHEKAPSKEIVECPKCNKKYTKQYMVSHLLTHNEVNPFRCEKCQKSFSCPANLRKHRRTHEPGYKPPPRYKEGSREGMLECKQCGKLLYSASNLKVHMRQHTGERPFKCSDCSLTFVQTSHLNRHKRTKHGPNSSEGKPQRQYPCKSCDKVFTSSGVLSTHIKTVHNGERPHKCNHCDATFTQHGHLWRHKHAFHADSQEVQEKIASKNFTCEYDGCELAFPCRSDLMKHHAEHQNDKPFKCDQCSSSFMSTGNLNKHKRNVHLPKEGSYPCSVCNKAFDAAYKLRDHNRIHFEKGFKCEHCGATFVQRSNLLKHIRCVRCPALKNKVDPPTQKSSHVCEDCGKNFSGPADLKAHKRIHTGDRPFSCPICGVSFNQQGNLTRHVKYLHEKKIRPKEKPRERKYYCSLCGKPFRCPSTLAQHCRIHTGVRPFGCKVCDRHFTQLGNLMKHMKTHNPDRVDKRKLRKKKSNEADKTTLEDSELDETGPLDEDTESEMVSSPPGNDAGDDCSNTSTNDPDVIPASSSVSQNDLPSSSIMTQSLPLPHPEQDSDRSPVQPVRQDIITHTNSLTTPSTSAALYPRLSSYHSGNITSGGPPPPMLHSPQDLNSQDFRSFQSAVTDGQFLSLMNSQRVASVLNQSVPPLTSAPNSRTVSSPGSHSNIPQCMASSLLSSITNSIISRTDNAPSPLNTPLPQVSSLIRPMSTIAENHLHLSNYNNMLSQGTILPPVHNVMTQRNLGPNYGNDSTAFSLLPYSEQRM